MQTTTVKSLGFKNLTKLVPDSVEEFDRLAKRAGAALDEANRNILYRSVLADFRTTFLHGSDEEKDKDGVVTRSAIQGLEELTGIKRKTKITKPEVREASTTDAAGNEVLGKITQEEVSVWDETEDEFFTRLLATQVKNGEYPSVEAAQEALTTQAQAVLTAVPFDPSKTERKSAGPKKTPNSYVETAKEIVAATGSLENAIAAFNRKNVLGLTLADTATIDDLAAGVWKDQTAKKKQIAGAYAG